MGGISSILYLYNGALVNEEAGNVNGFIEETTGISPEIQNHTINLFLF